MEPEKQRILRKMINDCYGKYPTAALPILIRVKNELGAKGLYFSKEETETIIDILTAGMSPSANKMIKNLIR